jgi:hypothetical protein
MIVARLTGTPYKLRPYERVLSIEVTPKKVAITSERFTIVESPRSVKQTARFISLTVVSPNNTGGWVSDFVTMPDPDFTPKIIDTTITSPLESEYRDRLAYEGMCYRPGRGTDYERVGEELVRAYNKLDGTPREQRVFRDRDGNLDTPESPSYSYS